ncbi:MAG: hypothetical protein Q7K43_01700 [Candidatus Woesearchaeota archaeon]|nr:hypothetical protein [Candidatus Woesearchaeota archaeon]
MKQLTESQYTGPIIEITMPGVSPLRITEDHLVEIYTPQGIKAVLTKKLLKK